MCPEISGSRPFFGITRATKNLSVMDTITSTFGDRDYMICGKTVSRPASKAAILADRKERCEIFFGESSTVALGSCVIPKLISVNLGSISRSVLACVDTYSFLELWCLPFLVAQEFNFRIVKILSLFVKNLGAFLFLVSLPAQRLTGSARSLSFCEALNG